VVNVLLIGPPGAGKGTQGERLARRLDIEHLAAGDLLRAEVEAGSPIGKEVSELMSRGELVPDETILELVVPRILDASAKGGYLLDGFPRSVEQAREARRLAELGDSTRREKNWCGAFSPAPRSRDVLTTIPKLSRRGCRFSTRRPVR
jgi:adenylate kinase